MLHLLSWFRLSVRGILWVVGLFCLALIPDPLLAQGETLEIVEQEPISLITNTSQSFMVTVRNPSPTEQTLQFSLVIHDDTGTGTPTTIPILAEQVEPNPATVGAHRVHMFRLMTPRVKGAGSGYLVVTGGGDQTTDAAHPVTVKNPGLPLLLATTEYLDLLIIGGSLVGPALMLLLALGWAILRYCYGSDDWIKPNDYILLAPVTWAQGSWVANTAAVGAVINVVIGARDLTETPQYFSAEQYQGLALLFAAVGLVALLPYNWSVKNYSFQTLAGNQDEQRGRVGAFLLTVGLIVYAAFGQWLLALLLLDELRSAKIWSVPILWVFALGLLGIFTALLWHAAWDLLHLLSTKVYSCRELKLLAQMARGVIEQPANASSTQPTTEAAMAQGMLAPSREKAMNAAAALRSDQWSLP